MAKDRRNLFFLIVSLTLIFSGLFLFVDISSLQEENSEIRGRVLFLEDKIRNSSSELAQRVINVEFGISALQGDVVNLKTSKLDFEKDVLQLQKDISTIGREEGSFSFILPDVIKSTVNIISENSGGSGFFISNNGFILTNAHVIVNTERLSVKTFEGETFSAVFVGKSETADIALIKIQKETESLIFGNSDLTRAGERVIAIGNPLGISFTVTEGIVSAVNRIVFGLNFVQTDAVTNSGNSGGPLINTKGEVIAVNNFKIGGGQGLTFSLSSNEVERITKEILAQNNIVVTEEVFPWAKKQTLTQVVFGEGNENTTLLVILLVIAIIIIAVTRKKN